MRFLGLDLATRVRVGYWAFYTLVLIQFLPAILMFQGEHPLSPGNLFPFISWLKIASPVLLLLTLGCIFHLKGSTDEQFREQEELEEQLRRERGTLEARIEERTWELKAAMKERMRVEQLDRGRSEVLEMMARDEPTEAILGVLVEVLARHRDNWACALHLLAGDALEMSVSSGLPEGLGAHLQHLDSSMEDAPENEARRGKSMASIHNTTTQRKPWTELLAAVGIRSVLSSPVNAPSGQLLGTLTIYMRLERAPSTADLELLQNHCQMASMVLERSRLQGELRRHAYHDSLTSLPNRLLGQERLTRAVLRAKRHEERLAVLWIDLNKFKTVNDVQGHSVGDAVLLEIAERLSVRMRGSDTVARMGGDEFMVLMERVPDSDAVLAVALDLLSSIELPILLGHLELHISASMGIAMFPEHGASIDELERNADIAMYQAKFGRLGIQIFSPMMDRAMSERRELETEMKKGLEQGGFLLHYQPQCDWEGQVVGLEALLRFTHHTLGSVPPSRMIPVAEQSDLIVHLGTWVLREACRQNRQWQDEGLPAVRVAVNISAMQFSRKDFAAHVSKILEETGLQPEYLELEMTESVLVEDFEESIRQLGRLKSLGVSIAIDDFGTGYSSLSYLHQLPVDRLKIDRSFITPVNDGNSTLPIVEAIIAMAQSKGLDVVAEGVETTAQMTTLRRTGCNLLQGFFLSRPVTAEAASAILSIGSIEGQEVLLPAAMPISSELAIL